MISIDYPAAKPKLKEINAQTSIFCMVRKIWLVLTPEEWVRQHFLLYLTAVLRYPASIIAVEKQIIIANRKKRFDIIVYKNMQPYIIVECKEMKVALTEHTMMQVLGYNSTLQANIIIVTNGVQCAAFEQGSTGWQSLSSLPYFKA